MHEKINTIVKRNNEWKRGNKHKKRRSNNSKRYKKVKWVKE